MNQTKTKFYFIILAIASITYDQSLALNALLISIIITGYFLMSTNSVKTKKWKIAALLWVISGLGLTLSRLDIGPPLFIITGLNFFAVHYHQKISFPISILQSCISFYTGIIRFFKFKKAAELDTTQKQNREKEILKKVLLIIIPVFIITIFLKLYQAANPKFKDYTSFLNLDFVEWQFLLFYGLLLIFSFGFFFFKPSHKLLENDIHKASNLNASDFSSARHSEAIEFEWQIGTIIVSSLIILLIAFIGVDLYSSFVEGHTTLSHSQMVHQGINILIISIILVIIIVLYLFRGGLNFKKSKALKQLTYSWLFLNCILVFLISHKNYDYIFEWGLTHKRIGVFIYLLLCLIGLVFTGLKIKQQTTTSLLTHQISITFLSILVFFSVLNWNGIIAKHNLKENNLSADKIDMMYLINLGPETYPYITQYVNNNKPISNYNLSLLKGRINQLSLQYHQDWKHFPSFTAGGLNAFLFTQSHQIERSRSTY